MNCPYNYTDENGWSYCELKDSNDRYGIKLCDKERYMCPRGLWK